MRKLKLDVEQLEVESFHTHAGVRRPGTVQGHRQDFEHAQAEGAEVAITVPMPLTPTCPQVTFCASCVNTCETCYGPTCMTACGSTCASGGPVCCA